MAENQRENAECAVNWGAVGRAYVELMDDVMPYLSPAEQLTYQRLFRLSHVQGGGFATCRYSELAGQCGLSVSTLQRALRGLRAKQLVTTGWQSHGATTFEVQLLSTLPQRPAFLPRRPGPARNASARPLSRPRVYDAFSPEDRDLFLTCKRSLSPARLNELTEAAVEWLTERADGDPEAFSEEILRDKVDELVFRDVFGVERQTRYAHLFEPLYQG